MNTQGDAQGWDSKSFEAKYRGTCPACEEAIEPGESVHYVGTTVVHDDCDRAQPAGQAKPTRFQGTSLEEMGF